MCSPNSYPTTGKWPLCISICYIADAKQRRVSQIGDNSCLFGHRIHDRIHPAAEYVACGDEQLILQFNTSFTPFKNRAVDFSGKDFDSRTILLPYLYCKTISRIYIQPIYACPIALCDRSTCWHCLNCRVIVTASFKSRPTKTIFSKNTCRIVFYISGV